MSQPKQQTRQSGTSSSPGNISKPKPKSPPQIPRPSASIILLSPTNEVLLLHRVQTSTSFPSAHVFPGGNLSPFHEPPLEPSATHQDALPYRLAAIRETFEESGILLAKKRSSGHDDALISLDPEAARSARRDIHDNRVKFTDLLSSLDAEPCTDDLVPFTRWITPAWSNGGRRFSTQMYLFPMPLSSPNLPKNKKTVDVSQSPSSDGGLEHTAATFAPAASWLRRQRAGDIVLFPPQCFLLTMVERAFKSANTSASAEFLAGGGGARTRYVAQRKALLAFVTKTPGEDSAGNSGAHHPTALIPWTEKTMSPEILFVRKSDGRLVLGLDKPAAELRGTGRGGDFERVVLAKFDKGVPTKVEVRNREDVLREEKEAGAREESEKGQSKL